MAGAGALHDVAAHVADDDLAGAGSAADGARSSIGRSSAWADGVVDSSTPGSVGCMRSPTDRIPIASRLSYGRYAMARRRKM